MESYRFGGAWRALGVTAVALGVALPLLMVANNERIDVATALTAIGLAAFGAWCYAYFARYLIAISAEGFTVHRLGRRPFAVAWRDVISVRSREGELVFATSDHRKIAVSVHFPGYAALENAAARHLPDTAFESAGHRPEVIEDVVDHDNQRMQHRANQRFWLRASARSLLFASGLAAAAVGAGVALTHLDLRAMPRAVGVTLIYVLAFVQSWGYTTSAVLVILAVLFVIMSLQEVVRARRLPPAA